jgi:hypothetical protein
LFATILSPRQAAARLRAVLDETFTVEIPPSWSERVDQITFGRTTTVVDETPLPGGSLRTTVDTQTRQGNSQVTVVERTTPRTLTTSLRLLLRTLADTENPGYRTLHRLIRTDPTVVNVPMSRLREVAAVIPNPTFSGSDSDHILLPVRLQALLGVLEKLPTEPSIQHRQQEEIATFLQFLERPGLQ